MAFGFAGAAQGVRQVANQQDDSLLKWLMARQEAKAQQEQLALQRAAAERAAAQQQLQASQFDQQMALRRDQFGLDQQQDARRAAQEDEAAKVASAERSTQRNQEGVRRMVVDGLRLRTITPEQARLTAFGEGVEVPNDVIDPGAEQRQLIELENLRHRNDLSEIGAREAGDLRLLGARGAQAEKMAAAEARAKAPAGPSPYMQERNLRNLQSIDELTSKVGNWTTGVGSLLANLPATDARDFAAELNTLKANIAFGELTAMREASKTGGALGAVSERELALLESALGALDPGQSPENLKAQLQKIKESIMRWNAAQATSAPLGAASPAAPTGGGKFNILGVE